ncbi:response regulator transcription factor [Actinophytocola sediminis]
MGAQGIPVGVVEGDAQFSAALLRLLEAAPDMVVDAVGDSVARFAARRRWSNSIVVMDPDLPVMRNADAVRALTRMGHRVLVLSARTDVGWVHSTLAAGAHGCLSKQAESAAILAAIRRIASGQRARLTDPGAPAPATVPSWLAESRASLTARERDVLTRLVAGDRDQDIAQTLRISVRTVRSYLERVRDKTGLRRRPELIRYAIEQGVVSDDRVLATRQSA